MKTVIRNMIIGCICCTASLNALENLGHHRHHRHHRHHGHNGHQAQQQDQFDGQLSLVIKNNDNAVTVANRLADLFARHNGGHAHLVTSINVSGPRAGISTNRGRTLMGDAIKHIYRNRNDRNRNDGNRGLIHFINACRNSNRNIYLWVNDYRDPAGYVGQNNLGGYGENIHTGGRNVVPVTIMLAR
jgi:hypothetical protein